MESAARTLLEAASWLGWWLVSLQLMVLANSSKVDNCHRLYVAGVRAVMIISKSAFYSLGECHIQEERLHILRSLLTLHVSTGWRCRMLPFSTQLSISPRVSSSELQRGLAAP